MTENEKIGIKWNSQMATINGHSVVIKEMVHINGHHINEWGNNLAPKTSWESGKLIKMQNPKVSERE